MERKSITLTLYMSELIYDIQNKTYLTGRSRNNGKNHEEVANMQVNEDEENKNQVIRSIGNAFANLKTKLSEYIEESGTTANNKLGDGTTNLSISLDMPSNYNNTCNDAIATAMHQYIVNICIGEWFNITNKADASDYITLAGADLEEIREALNKRVRPTRTSVDNTPSQAG